MGWSSWPSMCGKNELGFMYQTIQKLTENDCSLNRKLKTICILEESFGEKSLWRPNSKDFLDSTFKA